MKRLLFALLTFASQNCFGQNQFIYVECEINSDAKHCYGIFFIPSLDADTSIIIDSNFVKRLNNFETRIYFDKCEIFEKGTMVEVDNTIPIKQALNQFYSNDEKLILSQIALIHVNARLQSDVYYLKHSKGTFPKFYLDNNNQLRVEFNAFNESYYRLSGL